MSSKLLASTRFQPTAVETAIEAFMEEAKASGEMARETRVVSFRRLRDSRLKVNLSDDTFLILHLVKPTKH